MNFVRIQVNFGGVLCVVAAMANCADAGEILQTFPADQPVAKMQTAWRIVWGVTRHAGQGEILYIKEAYFQRAPREPEVKVLGDCRIAEIFVPYNDGERIYDIASGFDLEDITKKDLGPACIGPPRLFDRDGKQQDDKGLVAAELHDDHLRWKNRYGQSRRGQELHLWSVLDASNYRYVILYVFRDDGQVSFRLGSTAHNLRSTASETAAHLHIGCWRLNVELGNAAKNDIQVVRYVFDPSAKNAKTVVEKFNNGKEGGIEWKAEEFTRLRVQSRVHKNAHDPARFIGYELISKRHGNPRLRGRDEEFTLKDFWVTRASAKPEELRYRRVPVYANGEALNGPCVIWHQSAAWHAPRDEDFGQKGYEPNQGAALTVWCGFDLRPRNFFSKTPLYP